MIFQDCAENITYLLPQTSSRTFYERSKHTTVGYPFNYSWLFLGCLAMSCINEIISKNCFPTEYENFLIQMFQQTFNILQQLTRGSSSQDRAGVLSKLDEKWVILNSLSICFFRAWNGHIYWPWFHTLSFDLEVINFTTGT